MLKIVSANCRMTEEVGPAWRMPRANARISHIRYSAISACAGVSSKPPRRPVIHWTRYTSTKPANARSSKVGVRAILTGKMPNGSSSTVPIMA